MRSKLQAVSFFLFIYLFVPFHSVQAQIRDWADPDGNPATNDSCLVNGVPTLKCIEVVVANILFMSNAFILLVLFIMFLIGSFKYLTSLGEAEKVQDAQGTFKWAIIGLFLYISAYMILRTIDVLFLGGQGTIFQFRIGGP
ncbi:MAG: hypothetical protein ACEQSA_05290 [Weeksellaceae bacterium]